LASIGDPEETATEYMHYRQFFTIWELFDRVAEVEAAEGQGGMTKDSRTAWLNDYKVQKLSRSDHRFTNIPSGSD
jgi:nuclear pore complex protein Nup107